jgi:hypothetical protein
VLVVLEYGVNVVGPNEVQRDAYLELEEDLVA